MVDENLWFCSTHMLLTGETLLHLPLYVLFQYEQFARTVADAAIDQQAVLRQALAQFKDTIALAAKMKGDNWPYFIPPMYETWQQTLKRWRMSSSSASIILSPTTNATRTLITLRLARKALFKKLT